MSKTLQGGRRPGSGRPRKGTDRRVSISITISQSAADKARKLRASKFPLNEHLEDLINEKYDWFFAVGLAD